MRKFFKWLGIWLGVVIGLVLLAGMVLYIMGGAQLNKTRQVQPAALVIPDDEASLARGEHLVNARLTNGDVWHCNDYGDTWENLPFNFPGIWRSLIVLDQ